MYLGRPRIHLGRQISDRPNGIWVATYPSNVLWLPSSQKSFVVALLPHPLQVTSAGMVYPQHSAQFEVHGTNLPCRGDSVASNSYMRAAGAGQNTLIILRSQSLYLVLTVTIRKAQLTSLCSPCGSITKGKENRAGNPKCC